MKMKNIVFTTAGIAAIAIVAAVKAQQTISINVPTNIPPALIEAEMIQSARAIALMQIQRATLVQLETASPALTNLDAGNLPAARQIMATTIRATTDVTKLNQIIAAMPAPVVSGSQTATNIP
jgi:hypothetical protein